MSVTIHTLQGQLQWRAERGASGRWIAVCDAMGLVTEADTLDEMYSVINEMLQLLFTDLLMDNEFDDYLREHGWTATNVPHRQVPDDVTFDVPWELVAASASRDPERRPN